MSPDPRIAKRYGPFEIRRHLGSGAMGDVYLGWDTKVGRAVAVKFLSRERARDRSFVTRFRREAEALGSLEHQHVVGLYAWGEVRGDFYIAMQFVDGLDLDHALYRRPDAESRIPRFRPLPLQIALAIARDICLGLEHLHEHDVIHRDLKPANVMLSRRGIIKIADFGLARRVDESSLVTVLKQAIGTPSFMSPEQAAGQTDLDARVDVFAMGVMVYDLLTGRLPFRGSGAASVFYGIQNLDPHPIGEQNPLVSTSIIDMVGRMLVKDRSQRCQTIREARLVFERELVALGVLSSSDLLREFVEHPRDVADRFYRESGSRDLRAGVSHAGEERTELMPQDEAIDADDEASVSGSLQSGSVDSSIGTGSLIGPAIPHSRPSRVVLLKAYLAATALALVAVLVLIFSLGNGAKHDGEGSPKTADDIRPATPSPAPTQSLAPSLPDDPAPAQAPATTSRLRISPVPSDGRVTAAGFPPQVGTLDRDFEAKDPVRVRVEREGYEPRSLSVRLTAGRDTQMVIRLAPLPSPESQKPPVSTTATGPGRIELKLDQAAQIWVNDALSATGKQKSLVLDPGVYRIRASAAGYPEKVWDGIRIESGATLPLDWSFAANIGVLVVRNAGDHWGVIRVSGVPGTHRGNRTYLLAPGTYEVEVEPPFEGFEVVSDGGSVRLASGDTLVWTYKIQKLSGK